MKLVMGVCSSQSRASLCHINGGSLSTRAFAFSSRPFSGIQFKRLPLRKMFHHNKVARNGSAFMEMCYSCVTRFYGSRQKASASVSSRGRCQSGNARNLSTFAAPLLSSTNSLVIRSPSSLVLAAQVTHSDTPQRSEEWFALRRDKLTTSTFSTALGFWKGNRRCELWNEKVFEPETQVVDGARKFAMDWGVLNEAAAIDRYKSITGREVSSLGFAIHAEERFGWLGASPDGVLSCFQLGNGILEVKCPYNKGKPEKGLPWSKMPFYYMPQVQGQMEIMGREWLDLYCWTPNGSTIFRVCRDRSYWELMHGILREFWWENVVPAKEALSVGREEEVKSYQPSSTHKLTGLAIFKSAKLAGEAKLLCREIAGHVEFYTS